MEAPLPALCGEEILFYLQETQFSVHPEGRSLTFCASPSWFHLCGSRILQWPPMTFALVYSFPLSVGGTCDYGITPVIKLCYMAQLPLR